MNAPSPIDSTRSGRVILVMEQYEKAYSPIEVIFSGRVIAVMSFKPVKTQGV